MAFATDNDLLKYIPTIFDHGVDSFSGEIAEAESDVLRHIQNRWFSKAYPGVVFDSTLLTASQWNRATVYLALYAYILPQLSTWRPDGDAFREQITFYKQRFAEEMEAELTLGVRYDFNNDSVISDSEIIAAGKRNRLYI